MAIKEALSIYFSFQWVNSHRLIIESDSSNEVKWVTNPTSVPWRLRWIVVQIENLKLQFSNWTIKHVLREANELANSLAKSGVHRLEDMVVFHDD
ncbi:hypothetical protein DITRI_Ditri13aG0032800 [Diplodiscus trichospermus]